MKLIGRKTVKAEKTTAPMVKTAKAGKTTAAAVSIAPTHEEIAKRSYELFLARGGDHGHAEEDWLQAERELSQ